MTLLELQNKLGETINQLTDESLMPGPRKLAFERAEYVAKIAKQMINNADVVLRTDKICGNKDRINLIVGEPDEKATTI